MRPRPPIRLHLVLAAAALVVLTHLMVAGDVPGDSWRQHVRSPAWAGTCVAAILFVVLLHRISPGVWLIAAGALANLSTWLNTGRIPDYMTVVVGERWVAFNLADAAIVIGALMVVWAVLVRIAAGGGRGRADPSTRRE